MCTTLPGGGVVGPIGAWWLVVVDMSCGRGSLAFASLCRHPKFGGSASSAPGIARGAARPVSSARDPSPWFTEAPPTWQLLLGRSVRRRSSASLVRILRLRGLELLHLKCLLAFS